MFRIIRVPAVLDKFFDPLRLTFTGTMGCTSACWSWP